MTTTTWTLTIEDVRHTIRLDHSMWSGKREIWLDGISVERKQIKVDLGSRHFLNIEGNEYEVAIAGSGFTYFYLLLSQNIPIPSDKELKKGKTTENLLQLQPLKDVRLWNELSQSLNLPYLNDRHAKFIWRHRLLGKLNGYLTLITRGFLPNPGRDGWSVLVRHSPPSSAEMLDRVRADPRIQKLLAGLKPTKRVMVINGDDDYTAIFLPNIKKETPAQLAERIQTFQNVIAEWSHPQAEGRCEIKTCRQPQVQKRVLVLFNGFPWLMCQECLDSIPQKVEESKKAYEKIPSRLLPGLMAGAGVTILGIIIMAVLPALLDVGVFVSLFLFIAILRVMDYFGTQRSKLSLTAAAGLSMIGVTLGELISTFFMDIQNGYPFSIQTFFQAWQMVFRPGPLLGSLTTAYFYTAIFGGILLWSFWSQQKGHLSRAFNPQVEIVPGKY